ncbi:MAG: ABC transporter permease [Hyphomicrobiales bacterium]|nr:ABC transporter permease [Hyphomicrobiales bacterium]
MMRWMLNAWVALVVIFLTLPLAAAFAASFSTGAPLAFPPPGFTLDWYQQINPDFYAPLRLSLIIAAGATAVAAVVGTCAALALQRGLLPGKRLLAIFCLSPLMVPTLVIGVIGFRFTLAIWDAFGLSTADTVAALIIGHGVFCVPFVVRSALAVQANYDMALEEAALNLGASPVQAFLRVTLPLLTPGIAAGGIFAFLASFDDVPVALFLGGSNTVTLPVKIFTSIEFSFDASVMAVATLIVGGSIALMVVIDRLIGLETFLGTGRN